VLLFARYLDQRGLKAYRPCSIVTSAEGLEPDERALVERVFGCPVFNRYGCREVSVLASECPAHTGLHVMAEGLLVEIETPQGPAGPGEMGSILITDLLNDGMPLVRYRIGDLGSWAPGECPCGRGLPTLERIWGRAYDFVGTPDGRRYHGEFFMYLFEDLRRANAGVQGFQVTQDGDVLVVCPGTQLTEADCAAVRRWKLHLLALVNYQAPEVQ